MNKNTTLISPKGYLAMYYIRHWAVCYGLDVIAAQAFIIFLKEANFMDLIPVMLGGIDVVGWVSCYKEVPMVWWGRSYLNRGRIGPVQRAFFLVESTSSGGEVVIKCLSMDGVEVVPSSIGVRVRPPRRPRIGLLGRALFLAESTSSGGEGVIKCLSMGGEEVTRSSSIGGSLGPARKAFSAAA